MDRKSFQTQFDIVLKDYIQKKCHECSKYHSVDLIDDIINYTDSYARGGKRFRPYMVYVRYSMYGGVDTQYAMQVGLIHELIHLFALVHDDICDQGIIRHDISTYHRHITQMYGGDEHAGATQAMLVGDMIYTRAIELLLMLDLSADTRSLIYAMLQEVIVGQMVDVHLSLTPQLMSRDIISEKDHSKSGQYSFQCPMMVGASLT
jgi:geranylgeranyl diphosphate synthase type I